MGAYGGASHRPTQGGTAALSYSCRCSACLASSSCCRRMPSFIVALLLLLPLLLRW